MSVDNTDDFSVLKRVRIETPKPSYQPDTATSYYSKYTPITASTSTLSPSASLPNYLTSSSKSQKKIEPKKEAVKNICS